MTDVAVYRGFDQDELNLQYSPSKTVPDLGFYLDEYARRSARARRDHEVRTGLAYGPSTVETLDLFPAARPKAPLQVYVHGGYWQRLSKNESAFAAPGFLARGSAFAAVNYGLAPGHRLDEIVAMIRRAVWWLATHADEFDVDPGRIHLSGSSAGAHLVAMALLPGWVPDGRHPRELVAGATLLSGIYDLEPIAHTYVNDALGMDLAEAARNSPIRYLADSLAPVVMGRGELETGEFIRQHDEMTSALRDTGTTVTDVAAGGRNHYDVPYELADPDTELGAAVLSQMGLG